MHLYDERQEPGATAGGHELAVRAGETVEGARDSLGEKLAQWHLSPDDVKADLARTGRVVREKAQVAGDRIGDARIAAVIKAKYLLDRDISAMDISVAVNGGRVVLSGRVGSEQIIGRAMELALETEGVANVVSLLTIRPLN